MKYFVSYFMTFKDRTQAYGNTIYEKKHPMSSEEDIRAIEDDIEIRNEALSVTLISWRRLEDAE